MTRGRGRGGTTKKTKGHKLDEAREGESGAGRGGWRRTEGRRQCGFASALFRMCPQQ